jgi:hypothetical protein
MFRDKAKDAMRSGKVLRIHQFVATAEDGGVIIDEDGNQKKDEDVADFLYVGEGENYDSAIDRHARYRREDGEWTEVFDSPASGETVDDLVDENATYFDAPEETPVSPAEDGRE